MARRYRRREMVQLLGGACSGAGWLPAPGQAASDDPPLPNPGCVVGQPEAAREGAAVLAAGGNAVDAAVTAALVAAVVAPHQCGLGGDGGHLVLALPRGGKVTAIDFNGPAPLSTRPDLFAVDERGIVKDQSNLYGWRAVGVPGTLAGLFLVLQRYGTQSFRQVLQPAIRLAREGFLVDGSLAAAIRAAQALLAADPALARLLLINGEPLRVGQRLTNPDLATLLEKMAQDDSADDFYRGEAARKIAAAFAKNGGLLTEADLHAYRAREVDPLDFAWGEYSICTAPLTAGGLTVLQALAILKAMPDANLLAESPRATHFRLEALRLAWRDRLQFLGDPAHVKAPVERLLSEEYVRKLARAADAAVRAGKPSPATTDSRPAGGTIHLSAADARGMLVALTLTHGNHFGARVAVDGLGLILGHGMSRFDPRPGHPNAPGPRKRPLHNMCPTVVLRRGQPVLALGGAGGRKIPNAILDVLARVVGGGQSVEQAIAAPRLHTEGGLEVTLEARWPEEHSKFLQTAGYDVRRGPSAVVHAVAFDPSQRVPQGYSR